MGRLIIYGIIGYLVYYFWKWTMAKFNRMRTNLRENLQGGQVDPTAKTNNDGKLTEFVQDPVCKLYIAKDNAIPYKDHYFCSEKCRENYK